VVVLFILNKVIFMPHKYKKAELQPHQSVNTDISSDSESIPVNIDSDPARLPPVHKGDGRISPVYGAVTSLPKRRGGEIESSESSTKSWRYLSPEPVADPSRSLQPEQALPVSENISGAENKEYSFTLHDDKKRTFTSSIAAPGIFIERSNKERPNFYDETESDILKLLTTESGKKILSSIEKYSSKEKFILIYFFKKPFVRPRFTESQRVRFSSDDNYPPLRLYNRSAAGRAEGVSSELAYNSGQSAFVDSNGDLTVWLGIRKNQFVALLHELVHASRILKGTSTGDNGAVTDISSGIYNEEMRAVGLGRWSNKIPSENSLNNELGFPLRKSHSGMRGDEV
jgi:hypothetical protein